MATNVPNYEQKLKKSTKTEKRQNCSLYSK